MKKLCIVILSLVISTFSNAAENDLVLNGISVFSRLNTDFYIGALYLPATNNNPENIIDQPGMQKMEIRVLLKRLSTRKFSDLWNEGITINNPPALVEASQKDILEFINVIKDLLTTGDKITIIRQEDGSTEVRINDVDLLEITNKEFYGMLLRSWIGNRPPSTEFKNEILTLTQRSTALGRFKALTFADSRKAEIEGWRTAPSKQEKAKIEALAKAKAEAEVKAKAKAEADAQAKAATLAKEKAEQEAKAKALAETQAKLKAEELARKEAEAKAQAALQAKARTDALAKAQQEALARAQAETKAKTEALAAAENKAKAAEAKAQAEIDARAKAEADAQRKAQELTAAKAAAEAKAREESLAKTKAEADAKAKAEAETEARRKAEELAKAKSDADQKTREEAAALARVKVEDAAKAKADQLAQAAKAAEDLKTEVVAEAAAPKDEPNNAKSQNATRSQYKTSLLRQTYKYVTYPQRASARKQQGVIVLMVTVDQSGNVTSVETEKKSRYALLNQAALNAVKRAAPYPTIPKELAVNTFSFRVPVQFRLP